MEISSGSFRLPPSHSAEESANLFLDDQHEAIATAPRHLATYKRGSSSQGRGSGGDDPQGGLSSSHTLRATSPCSSGPLQAATQRKMAARLSFVEPEAPINDGHEMNDSMATAFHLQNRLVHEVLSIIFHCHHTECSCDCLVKACHRAGS